MIILGMIPDEPHSAVHVLDDLGNRELGLAAVDHGEDRVAPLEELVDQAGSDRVVRREPTAADHPDDGRAVGSGLGCEDVHRQRGPILAAVDNVDLSVERGLVVAMANTRDRPSGDEKQQRLTDHGVDSVRDGQSRGSRRFDRAGESNDEPTITFRELGIS